MQIIRDPIVAATIEDVELRTCIEKTIGELNEDGPYDPDVLGYFLIVEPGDTLEAISTQLGFPILCNRWTGIAFGHAGFTPSWEVVQAHAHWYEMVFVISDDGFGVVVFIPKTEGINPELLAMCARYASPAAQEAPEP
ncbi:hypothetical protein SAMN05216344_110118 [Polaromonas sp. OV174]|uniref:hypothetical protein n=1 Tax=Polaromonas sp. OV174 TaxID=1855300 RepID=UPI0008DFF13C|nr:hypothetical protein [Polaromonas sp. OV174]SFC17443.1 hypothetical protein SAMN05216344_110118 [Polaromonas sp. OV174]